MTALTALSAYIALLAAVAHPPTEFKGQVAIPPSLCEAPPSGTIIRCRKITPREGGSLIYQELFIPMPPVHADLDEYFPKP